MLKDAVHARMNEQLKHELSSAYVYFSMAAYFESISLKGFAHWMQMQAREELTHVLRIFNYINDRGAAVQLPAIPEPRSAWESPAEAMTDAYKHECFISEQINECVSLAVRENDHATNAFLQWFVAEQVEEEANADEIVQKLKLIGNDKSGLFLLDNELGKRQGAGDPTATA